MSKLRIPAPRGEEEGFIYIPIVRVGRTIPFGYRQDPDDQDVLLPVEKELKLLEDAKKHLRRFSLRDVSAWLSEESGRYISHMGLSNRIKCEQKRSRASTIQRQLVKQYEQAIKKAKRIEESYLGKKIPCKSETCSTECGRSSGEDGADCPRETDHLPT